jgi:toxin HigB-1
MNIRSVAHRGLRRFIERDDASALAPQAIERIRNIVTFLSNMENVAELRDIPAWKAHQLSGDRKGTWSLTVTRNWRITFRLDETAGDIVELDVEDYH